MSQFSSRTFWLGLLLFGLSLLCRGTDPQSRLLADEAGPPEPPAVEAAPEQPRDEEYYELLKLFADTLDQIDRNYVKDVSRRELMEAAIRGMITKLDQHSNYIPSEELESFRSDVESEFGGIGIRVSIDRGVPTVISPIVGSPAYRAGLLAGDRIVKIEGEPTEGITIDETVKRLKGKLGTKVTITVEHAAGEKRVEDVTLERDTVRVRTVLGDHRGENDNWNYFHDDEAKIGYIRVTSFGRHTTEEIQEALEKLQDEKMTALVLDLRFNPGGLLSEAIKVSDLFVDEGTIVSTEGRSTPKRSWEAHAAGTHSGFPMAILVNRYSASASEIVSACLQDHERAVVVGERTFGKGSVQNIISLEDGKSALKLTTAGYLRPSGENIDRASAPEGSDEWGVRPNEGLEVKLDDEQTAELYRFQRDRDIVGGKPGEADFSDDQLAKAVAYLKGELEEKP